MRKIILIALVGAALPLLGATPPEALALPRKLPPNIDLSQSGFTARAPQAIAKRAASGAVVFPLSPPSRCYFIRQLINPQKPSDKPRFVPLAGVEIAPSVSNPNCLTDSIVRKTELFR
ncbi:MAG: hypothetical protein ABI645_05770 [Pseudomonadota bacterium]